MIKRLLRRQKKKKTNNGSLIAQLMAKINSEQQTKHEKANQRMKEERERFLDGDDYLPLDRFKIRARLIKENQGINKYLEFLSTQEIRYRDASYYYTQWSRSEAEEIILGRCIEVIQFIKTELEAADMNHADETRNDAVEESKERNEDIDNKKLLAAAINKRIEQSSTEKNRLIKGTLEKDYEIMRNIHSKKPRKQWFRKGLSKRYVYERLSKLKELTGCSTTEDVINTYISYDLLDLPIIEKKV